MLGGEFVGESNSSGEVGREGDAAAIRQRLRDDVGAGEGLDLAGGFGLHGFGQFARGGEQNRGGERIVFGLREEIGGDPRRVGRVVGDDDGFGGAGESVEADEAEHLPFGEGDEQAAGANDFIHTGNRLCAERHGRDCLRAADTEHFIHAGDLRGGEDDGRHIAAGFAWRRADDDLFHACDAGRDGAHEERGGQRRRTTRHVDADTVERGDALAEGAIGSLPGGDGLLFVKGFDASGGELKIGQEIFVNGLNGFNGYIF